jgi:RimJ/RimL family protein N-acetyltransferase
MKIREINMDDAEIFTYLIQGVEADADFMLMGPGERTTTPEQHRKHIERLTSQRNSTIFVAEKEGKLVGYLMAIGGSVVRTQHSAYLVVGILKDYRGKGIGTLLFQGLEKWATKHNISRLELTVVTQNSTAVALYKKSGFEIEGTKRHSLIIDGCPYDEYYMSKLL